MIEIDPLQYKYIYIVAYLIPILYLFVTNVSHTGNQYLLSKRPQLPMAIYVGLIIVFIGFRPLSGAAFCDMYGYNLAYLVHGSEPIVVNWSTEWGWSAILSLFYQAGLSSTWWFAFVALGYFGCVFWTCKRMLYENVNVSVLFFLSSFTFFAYGTNTIRSGLATSIILLAISYVVDGGKKYYSAAILLLLALSIHRSTIITIVALLGSLFIIKKVRWAVIIWSGCILLSLFLGEQFSSFFSGLGIDDRMSTYMSGKINLSQFSRTGFRWDFLLYSSVPVFVSWIASVQKKIPDRKFALIANTYILSNSIWVLCNRVAYSDRFAYLSWFMYPLVMAYAFIRLPMYNNQDRITSYVLVLYASFTIIMALI